MSGVLTSEKAGERSTVQAKHDVDYIVVGSGSAGSVVAARLSEMSDRQVLLLEYGGSDKSIVIQMPSALGIPRTRKRFAWFYATEPEPNLNGRRLRCPRGKVLGGSSSINGMVHVRGNPLDYDRWEEEGRATGWSYQHCLPYFRKAETFERGGDAYRGDSGPLQTMVGPCSNPLYEAFIEAAVQAGYARTEDYNGFRQEGFGRMDRNVGSGRRSSTATAYLRPALRRPNLHLETHALVTRVLFEGRRAVGVEYLKGDVKHRVRARCEVILCGGPYNTPQLLQLSGLGAPDLLRRHGLEVVHPLSGVGENLQDHLEVQVLYACSKPITLNGKVDPLSRLLIGLRWLLFKSGLGATNHFESCGFIRTEAGVMYPNVQFHFMAGAISQEGKVMARQHGFQAYVGPMRSKSRGWVRIKSADPLEKPAIQFNYMSHEDDWREMRACIRLAREIFAQPALEPYRGEELAPGAALQDDDQLDDFVRRTAVTGSHPCSTCKMGPAEDPTAVVDHEGRVHGVEHLRVIDSSVMPLIVNGNLNAPTIMLAEKLADAVRGTQLPRSNAPYYIHPEWQTRQR